MMRHRLPTIFYDVFHDVIDTKGVGGDDSTGGQCICYCNVSCEETAANKASLRNVSQSQFIGSNWMSRKHFEAA